MIEKLKLRILNGGEITEQEAYQLAKTADKEALYAASAEITGKFGKKMFDFCSIVNARSGLCGENCKWCAQSAHYKTGVETYSIVDEKECVDLALHNASKGVHRFSMVTSGLAIKGEVLDKLCCMYRKIREKSDIYLCASMGLINAEEMQKLWDAGVRRYHCNLETAPSHFPSLCTTHSIDDKLLTISHARKLGMDICSGGIIGMGETAEQRVEFALTLRRAKPVSIPVNLLIPIPGTPLENEKPLSEEDILTTIAIMRFVHPKAEIRFAGGRIQFSGDFFKKAVRIGVNGSITGDMLTTTGNKIDQDRATVIDLGLTPTK